MKTATDTKGDLGEFIIAELAQRGIAMPKPRELPKLPAIWRLSTVALPGAGRSLGATAQGCALTEVLAFCFALFSTSREDRPLSSDDSFFFGIKGGLGHFSRTKTGLVVSFLALQQTLTIRQYQHGLHLGFADHATA